MKTTTKMFVWACCLSMTVDYVLLENIMPENTCCFFSTAVATVPDLNLGQCILMRFCLVLCMAFCTLFDMKESENMLPLTEPPRYAHVTFGISYAACMAYCIANFCILDIAHLSTCCSGILLHVFNGMFYVHLAFFFFQLVFLNLAMTVK